ncbi:trypsin-like serine protease [Thiospirochaeta perfilievii]|uniref:Trypsin-like serine protease n=1 Tax=Thiospirochaeta perfilievii TaxID=252967 RepID=A0A5C1QIJ9_9SPIO|nr:trypsin-like peptidase domain-containing protein [Thiospirochaeta perfilievii]QEN06306.1 trypsin-like serine protease [Thiospirochaeta perfilievii]
MNISKKALKSIILSIIILTLLLVLSGVVEASYKKKLLGNLARDITALNSFQFTDRESTVKSIANRSELSPEELNNMDIYKTLNRAVVNITTKTLSYNWAFEVVPKDSGTGSGSIISQDGYILTNYHIIENVYEVFVTLYDGSEYEGRVVGTDIENDLTVIKFDPKGKELTVIPFGISNDLAIGQKVLAIGNPFGFDRTLTTGVISGTGRPLHNNSGYLMLDMIQTDASINPGNSGGPLLDSTGKMIGVNTMIYSKSGGSDGIGFALPIDSAKRSVNEIITYGEVRRGWIDIDPIELTPALVRYANLKTEKGILISSVIKGGNAWDAGLKGGDKRDAIRYKNSVKYLGGDIITSLNGYKLETISDLFTALQDTKPGESVSLKYIRGNRLIETKIKLSTRKK